MRRRTLRIDAAIALGLMILLVIISPGLAVVGIVALVILLICGISFVLDQRRAAKRSRRRPRPARISEPPRRRSPGSRG